MYGLSPSLVNGAIGGYSDGYRPESRRAFTRQTYSPGGADKHRKLIQPSRQTMGLGAGVAWTGRQALGQQSAPTTVGPIAIRTQRTQVVEDGAGGLTVRRA